MTPHASTSAAPGAHAAPLTVPAQMQRGNETRDIDLRPALDTFHDGQVLRLLLARPDAEELGLWLQASPEAAHTEFPGGAGPLAVTLLDAGALTAYVRRVRPELNFARLPLPPARRAALALGAEVPATLHLDPLNMAFDAAPALSRLSDQDLIYIALGGHEREDDATPRLYARADEGGAELYWRTPRNAETSTGPVAVDPSDVARFTARTRAHLRGWLALAQRKVLHSASPHETLNPLLQRLNTRREPPPTEPTVPVTVTGADGTCVAVFNGYAALRNLMLMDPAYALPRLKRLLREAGVGGAGSSELARAEAITNSGVRAALEVNGLRDPITIIEASAMHAFLMTWDAPAAAELRTRLNVQEQNRARFLAPLLHLPPTTPEAHTEHLMRLRLNLLAQACASPRVHAAVKRGDDDALTRELHTLATNRGLGHLPVPENWNRALRASAQ